MGNLDKWELKHVKDIARYEKAIQRIYTTYTQEAAKIGASISGFDPTKPLSFADYPLTNKLIKDLQRRMAKDIKTVVVNGVDEQWALSDDKAGELVEELFADLTDAQREAYIRRYLTTRERAREAFKTRKDAGLGLSDRVWQYTDQYKEEIEMAIDLGLREGESAAQMTLSLRKYLNNPDMLFRRVRDEHGMLHLSKRAKAYHPGQGVYRSSYKNARRLAATETNMAYRSADYQRNQSLDFVVGIRIKLSNNHTLNGEPFTDICDWLSAPNGSTAISGRGCYPKDFKFTGWHPLCRCFTQTIHKTREEIAEDARRIRQGLSPLPPSTSKNYVGDVPDEFKAWCKLNAARVERAKSLPYFIRDNRDYYDDALNPRKKTLTPLEVAKHRHEQRTPEHIESIKNRWHERQEKYRRIELAANNVLKVAKDYGEVDYTLLQQYVDSHDLKGMASVTRTTAKDVLAMKQAEAKLATLIPDAHKWHKQYTIAELQQVYDAVEKKLATIKNLPLEQQLKKLEFEMQYVADPTKYKPGATKYPTWKVSQDAYGKQYEDVLEAIEWQNIKNALFDAQTFKTKSPQYKALLNDLEDAVLQKKKGTAQIALAELQAKRHSLEMSMARRAAKKLQGRIVHTSFDSNDYSQASKNNAIWCKDARESHRFWDSDSEDVWNNASTGEREAWRAYTGGSGHMNRPLRGYERYWSKSNFAGVGNVDLNIEGGEQHIRDLYNLCERTTFNTNRWLQRGIETWDGVEGFFGINGLTRAQLRGMVGKEVCDYAFMSCGSAKGTGFNGLILNIYCPKGTKGFYACPHSYFGDSENETILQAGTRFRILKVEAPDRGTCYVDMEVIGYMEHPSLI